MCSDSSSRVIDAVFFLSSSVISTWYKPEVISKVKKNLVPCKVPKQSFIIGREKESP